MTNKKTRFMRIAIIAALSAGALIVVGIGYLNWMMSQPLYSFGSVRAEKNLRAPLEPPQQKDNQSWLVEPDITLTYHVHGNGKPVLVVHGGPGIPYASLWKGLGTLTDKHRFYFYHQRGCGNSTRPINQLDGDFYSNMIELDKTLGIGAQVADIERIRRILGQDQLTIIGHSFGGFIATLYAAEFPERVEKLVLVAPAGVLTPPSKDTDLFALTRARLDENRQIEFDAVKEEYFNFGEIFSKTDADLVDLHQRMGEFILEAMGYSTTEIQAGKSGGWAVFAVYFSGGRSPNFAPALKEITATTLIVHGKDDEIAVAGSKSYQAIRGSRFVMLDRDHQDIRAGHMIFDDSPKSFGEVVGQFLAE